MTRAHPVPPETSGLQLDVTVQRTGFTLDLDLTVRPGTVTALVGPNGAGKSTALRVAAGLLRSTTGRVTLDGRVLDDTSGGVSVPPAGRGIGVVFQDYLLFPHLTAVENVAFGLVARGARRADAVAAARRWLAEWGLEPIADRRPAGLSGGQAQRVALSRALILTPSLLLLDEPLAALDASTRIDIRADLGGRLRAFGGATILVTHDPIDALALADEMVVLDAGQVVQRGTPPHIASAPANAYIAGLLGMNRLTRPGRPAAVFLPSATRLVDAEPEADGGLAVRCTVVGVEEFGGRARVLLATKDGDRISAEIDVAAHAASRLRAGQVCWATVAVGDIR